MRDRVGLAFSTNCQRLLFCLTATLWWGQATAQETLPSEDQPVFGVLNLKFDKVKGATSYEYQVERQAAGGKWQPWGSQITLAAAVFTTPLPYGTYRIRYRPVGGGTASDWSPPREAQTPYPRVIPLVPKPNDTIKATSEKRSIDFRWEPNKLIHRFRVDVENTDTKERRSEATTDNHLSLQLANNSSYRWRVYPAGKIPPPKDPAWLAFAIAGKDAGTKQGLSMPVITTASHDAVSWSPVAGARGYRVTLLGRAKGKKTRRLFSKRTKKTSYNLTKFTRQQQDRVYTVRIRALAKGQRSPDAVIELSSQGYLAPSELNPVAIKNDLPPTNIKLLLDLSFGSENLAASGLIGEFSGAGALLGGFFIMEALPRPESNMMFIQVQLETDQFASQTVSENQTTGVSTTTEISYNRVGGSLTFTGRSALSEDFWGFGVDLYSQAMPVFESEDEDAGTGNLDSLNLRGIGAVFHWRHEFLGGQLLHLYQFSPFAAQTKSLTLFNATLRQRYALSKSFEVSGSLRLRYVNAVAQTTCSKNQPDLCAEPQSTQTMGIATIGVNLNL